jgi:hypothetical protein
VLEIGGAVYHNNATGSLLRRAAIMSQARPPDVAEGLV